MPKTNGLYLPKELDDVEANHPNPPDIRLPARKKSTKLYALTLIPRPLRWCLLSIKVNIFLKKRKPKADV